MANKIDWLRELREREFGRRTDEAKARCKSEVGSERSSPVEADGGVESRHAPPESGVAGSSPALSTERLSQRPAGKDADGLTAGVATGPSTYRYRDPEKRRKYMRDLMKKKRAKERP